MENTLINRLALQIGNLEIANVQLQTQNEELKEQLKKANQDKPTKK